MKRFVVIKDAEGREEALSIPHIQKIEKTEEGCIVHYIRPFDNIEIELHYKLSVEEVTKAINMEVEEAEDRGGNNKNRCPVCERPIKICKGKFGFFIGCSGFPKCTWGTSAEEWMLAKEDPKRWAIQRTEKVPGVGTAK